MNLTHLLQRNLQLCPNKTAFYDKNRTLTYGEFGEEVSKVAAFLKSRGVKKGDRVAILGLNSIEYIQALFGIMWAGAVVNPINIRWSPKEIIYSLNDSKSTVLLIDKTFSPLKDEIVQSKCAVNTFIEYENSSVVTQLQEIQGIEDNSGSEEELAMLLYTGGTTGFPKGVMLSHQNIMASTQGLVCTGDLSVDMKMLHILPMFHSAGLMVIYASFMLQASHFVLPMFSPPEVIETIYEHKVTNIVMVPSMVQMLIESPEFDGQKLASLKSIIYGASPMPLATLYKLEELLPNVGLTQGYGMTETAPAMAISPSRNHTPETRQSGRIKSAGLPIFSAQIKIVDSDGNELPAHEVGEILFKGPNVMMGYWNMPEVTEETIVDGWLKTGDGGYVDDNGWLFIVDRVKDMIISGGENIYSAEVENAVSLHPSVSQCAVIAIPSEDWGEAVHAVIVQEPSVESNLTLEELREFCQKHIAKYKCPRSLEITDALPLSSVGKLLKNELRKPYWEGKDRKVS